MRHLWDYVNEQLDTIPALVLAFAGAIGLLVLVITGALL